MESIFLHCPTCAHRTHARTSKIPKHILLLWMGARARARTNKSVRYTSIFIFVWLMCVMWWCGYIAYVSLSHLYINRMCGVYAHLKQIVRMTNVMWLCARINYTFNVFTCRVQTVDATYKQDNNEIPLLSSEMRKHSPQKDRCMGKEMPGREKESETQGQWRRRHYLALAYVYIHSQLRLFWQWKHIQSICIAFINLLLVSWKGLCFLCRTFCPFIYYWFG